MAASHIHALFDSTFMGVCVRQYWADIALWEKFLNDHAEIKTVVEMGTFRCGMSLFLLGNALNRGQKFLTFDRNDPEEMNSLTARMLSLRNHFVLGDFFEDTRPTLEQVITDPANKPLMLYVDGSNKPKEFNTFVPLLSTGDYCAIHDYTTEYKPAALDPTVPLLDPVFLEECERIRPCITRFWRVK